MVLFCAWLGCAQGTAAASQPAVNSKRPEPGGHASTVQPLRRSGADHASAAGLGSVAQPLQLLDSVKVSSATVTLADLIPADAPASVRAAAQAIVLGSAPQAGISRIISQAELAALLSRSPLTPPGLVLPRQVVIKRDIPLVSSRALLAVIQSALKNHPEFDAGSLTASQITLPLPIYARADESMAVDAIEQDASGRELRFRIRFLREPQRPAFFVMAPVQVNLPVLVATRSLRAGETIEAGDLRAVNPRDQLDAQKLVGFKLRLNAPAGTAVPRTLLTPAPLVVAGRPATMTLRGNGYTLTSTVIALQSAAMGQIVTVRNPRTRAIAEARVAGRGQVTPVKGAFHELQVFQH